jgi:hypothetical protein
MDMKDANEVGALHHTKSAIKDDALASRYEKSFVKVHLYKKSF